MFVPCHTAGVTYAATPGSNTFAPTHALHARTRNAR